MPFQSTDFREYIYRQRAESFIAQSTASTVSKAMVSLITAGVVWYFTHADGLVIWLSIALLHANSPVIVNHVLFAKPRRNWLNIWRYSNLLISFANGFLWGLVPHLFFPPVLAGESITLIILMVSIYTGYVAGALGISYKFAPSFFAFTLGISLPFVSYMFAQQSGLGLTIGTLSLFYVVAMSYVSWNFQQLFLKAANLQFQNTQLIEEMRISNNKLEETLESKKRLLTSLSHDLRQPLNVIGLFTDALLQRPLDADSIAQLTKIHHALGNVDDMLTELLSFAQLDALEETYHPSHFDLTTITQQLAVEHNTRKESVSVTCQTKTAFFVFADQVFVRRILTNVIDNAVKYTTHGQVSIHIALNQRGETDVCVVDTGMGIPRSMMASVFNEFAQVNNPERDRNKGIGLGLAIVKRLCEIAAFDYHLTSEPDRGTQFCLTIPTGAKPMDANTPRSTGAIQFKGLSVLVIDDDVESLAAMHTLLTELQATPLIARSQRAAQHCLNQSDRMPDLIICDLRLADNEVGTQVVEFLLEEFNTSIPAIIVSGDIAQLPDVKAQGFEVLTKPVRANTLLPILNDLLETPSQTSSYQP